MWDPRASEAERREEPIVAIIGGGGGDELGEVPRGASELDDACSEAKSLEPDVGDVSFKPSGKLSIRTGVDRPSTMGVSATFAFLASSPSPAPSLVLAYSASPPWERKALQTVPTSFLAASSSSLSSRRFVSRKASTSLTSLSLAARSSPSVLLASGKKASCAGLKGGGAKKGSGRAGRMVDADEEEAEGLGEGGEVRSGKETVAEAMASSREVWERRKSGEGS